ncbi:MAG TPA: transketolase [Gaiellaceae bacterium]|nr:transketolase [Gaiellaceae bacterium]
MANSELEQRSIDTIRTLSMDAVQQANAGHPGTAMALAPLAYLLYREVMRHSPANPHWRDRDRFVLSAGHACILQYCALHLAGYNLSLEELKRFRQWESLTPGHPEVHHTPGVEATTGPLGQGFANGVGFGIAERYLAERFNRPYDEIVDHRVYCICSDGDLMEGVSNEAASIAGQLGLGKLVYFYDDNHITIDGTTSLSFSEEDKGARLAAQGWHVQHVDDANDLDALRAAIRNAQAETERPSLVVIRSHIAFGAPRAVDTAKAHGSPLGEEEVRAAKEALGFDPDESFVIPSEVAEHMNVTERGLEQEHEWQRRFEAWSARHPALREEWDQAHTGRPRPGWVEALPDFQPGDGDMATRDAGGKTMEAFKRFTPTMIGGAADLVESTKTEFKGGGVFSATHAGRNVAFGIREFAMGAIVNGIALHDGMVKPYGSTFLVFSDYMRNAVRLSALSSIPAVWVWTHDSIGLGEDGPTHQPVEHYAALRAIPNLWFVRPADARETVGAWQVALERADGPVALALTRQKVPTLAETKRDGVARGAYVLWESEGSDGLPDLLLLATGSEVHVALDAGRRLAAEHGTSVRVVSMPCWELFEAQPQSYRDEVLPPDAKVRLSVEAGVAQGWHRWVGDEGDCVSVERFGASAPGATVLEKLGFTADAVVERALALRTRVS